VLASIDIESRGLLFVRVCGAMVVLGVREVLRVRGVHVSNSSVLSVGSSVEC